MCFWSCAIRWLNRKRIRTTIASIILSFTMKSTSPAILKGSERPACPMGILESDPKESGEPRNSCTKPYFMGLREIVSEEYFRLFRFLPGCSAERES